MVLIKGVKYACERCIRGHRVTTCMHTDQPLMMIKPKGRPSTQCTHCKEVRKIKNSHVKCKCGSKGGPYSSKCPCHVTGDCSCGSSTKKKPAKKQQPDLSDLEFSMANAQAMGLDTSSVSTTMNDPITSWDMNSLAPTLNDSNASLLSNTSPNTNGGNYSRKPYRQIGMDPLDNIKPVPVNLRQKRVGEISIPMDEYVKPLNNMNNNFTNLLNNITDLTSPLESPSTSNKGLSPDNNNNNVTTNTNTNPHGITASTSMFSGESSHSNPNKKQGTGFISDLYDLPIIPNSGGLLDFLDDTSQVPLPSQANTPNAASATATGGGGELDSFFPLHPLIGLSSFSNDLSYHSTGNSISSQNSNRLSTSNLSTHNNNNNTTTNQSQTSLLQQALKKIPTGSSTNSHHHLHHGGSHNQSNGHSSHFQPYPRRSSSFISVSSGHSIGSSINGGSPSNWDDPQILTAELATGDVSADVQPFFGGPQLSMAKTNTTLMDDIYQTKTYTESQNGDMRSRKSISMFLDDGELDPKVLEAYLNN